MQTIGILGAGKVGIVLAQLAQRAGYTVLISGSGPATKIALTTKILVPGARAVTNSEAAKRADIVILAAPLSKFKSLPREALAGKIVIDAMNHWPEVDGPRHDTIPDDVSSSEAVQAFLAPSTVVKAFSHMGYHELHDGHTPSGHPNRKAIAVAGDDVAAKQQVKKFIDATGFDPLDIGPLSHGAKLEPGTPAFGANTSVTKLASIIENE